jgi:hypothetical protein
MGNLLSLYPKIHCLHAHTQVRGRVSDRERQFFAGHCSVWIVFCCEFSPGKVLSHALLYGMLSIPQNELS